jgi:hypothetical protein
MGLLELIKQRTIEEAERIGRENGIEKTLKTAIKKMLSKDFSKEIIADILELKVVDVEKVGQEMVAKTYFEQDWTVEKVMKYFDEKNEKLLLSETELITLYQEIKKS